MIVSIPIIQITRPLRNSDRTHRPVIQIIQITWTIYRLCRVTIHSCGDAEFQCNQDVSCGLDRGCRKSNFLRWLTRACEHLVLNYFYFLKLRIPTFCLNPNVICSAFYSCRRPPLLETFIPGVGHGLLFISPLQIRFWRYSSKQRSFATWQQ
jgi:hypothetical protein